MRYIAVLVFILQLRTPDTIMSRVRNNYIVCFFFWLFFLCYLFIYFFFAFLFTVPRGLSSTRSTFSLRALPSSEQLTSNFCKLFITVHITCVVSLRELHNCGEANYRESIVSLDICMHTCMDIYVNIDRLCRYSTLYIFIIR